MAGDTQFNILRRKILKTRRLSRPEPYFRVSDFGGGRRPSPGRHRYSPRLRFVQGLVGYVHDLLQDLRDVVFPHIVLVRSRTLAARVVGRLRHAVPVLGQSGHAVLGHGMHHSWRASVRTKKGDLFMKKKISSDRRRSIHYYKHKSGGAVPMQRCWPREIPNTHALFAGCVVIECFDWEYFLTDSEGGLER